MMRQARSGSLMAQAYHHAILPLASVRDRRTEIRWAIRDVVLRTDRRPDGLWLPETAVDLATLRVAAEEGIRWTILAPWQAADGVDVRTPARIELGDGRWVVALFYDAGLSTTVSFDPAATADADRFAHAAVLPHLRADVSGRGMALICTDGELYGHHQPFRDLFLAAAGRTPPTTPPSMRCARRMRARTTRWTCPQFIGSAPAGPATTASRAGLAPAAAPPTAPGSRSSVGRSTASRAPSIPPPRCVSLRWASMPGRPAIAMRTSRAATSTRGRGRSPSSRARTYRHRRPRPRSSP